MGRLFDAWRCAAAAKLIGSAIGSLPAGTNAGVARPLCEAAMLAIGVRTLDRADAEKCAMAAIEIFDSLDPTPGVRSESFREGLRHLAASYKLETAKRLAPPGIMIQATISVAAMCVCLIGMRDKEAVDMRVEMVGRLKTLSLDLRAIWREQNPEAQS